MIVLSQSALDLISTLNLMSKDPNTKVYTPTRENYQYLTDVGLKNEVVLLEFSSLAPAQTRLEWFRNLYRDRKLLDQLVEEIRSETDEVVFHSYDNDPRLGYLIQRLSLCCDVILIDVLGLKPKMLNWRILTSKSGVRNLFYAIVMTIIFGPIFLVSGAPSYPILSLNLAKLQHQERLPSSSSDLEDYLFYQPLVSETSVLLLYAGAFGVGEEKHHGVFRTLVEILQKCNFKIIVKSHPQSEIPEYLEMAAAEIVPKHVPFELVRLEGFSLIVGVAGATLASPSNTPKYSLLKIYNDEGTDFYELALSQLSKNPELNYPLTFDEFQVTLNKISRGAHNG